MIHQAIEHDDMKTLRQTLDNKKLASHRDAAGFTVLHQAVLYERGGMVRYIVKSFPGVIDKADIVRGFGRDLHISKYKHDRK